MELIVNFTPTGMIPTKQMTPYVPVTVNEIIEQVHEAIEIGITMVHLHARDETTGKPTYHAEIYGRETVSGTPFSHCDSCRSPERGRAKPSAHPSPWQRAR